MIRSYVRQNEFAKEWDSFHLSQKIDQKTEKIAVPMGLHKVFEFPPCNRLGGKGTSKVRLTY